ncbi:ATP-binding protein [Pseudovibrio sp. Tun.PSC04-5.I4]|uniref:AAA family ATPase n=1 Tax=Pseudovibrio sp. Tun.PSC04-5.I4 TaxID=1798213 RepID=UPI0008858D7F|nr:ATP-binding protein [Pseudovibrio sp. Tun.PSC04-5.I4]SDR15977.1 AAA domain-containing protein [Pseudovibrio sp. Tun.PSC04-5.I4]SDR40337.1 AAA domain-containing protein [Pseudovibrio sp. Tun.PSC04-5.I4]
MRNDFVKTSNVQRFLNALTALTERGAQEACLVVVDGLPGLGKTTTLKNWVGQTGSIYLRAKKEWTPSWFMTELLETMGVHPPHAFQKKYCKALEELSGRRDTAGNERKTFGLVIDEADHVSSKSAILETIRDISDMIELPVILVGMGKVNDNLTRFPQVASRVSQKVRFEKCSQGDVRGLIDGRCEVRVADDLLKLVHKVSGGYNREILEAIANIERHGFLNPPGEEGLTMREMAGVAIINDRSSNRPIMVPGAL